MADCYGCPYRWHDSDCEYCSAKNDEIIDYKPYTKENCPYYKEYRAAKDSQSSSSSSSSSSYSSSDSNPGCGIVVIIAIIVAVIWAGVTFVPRFFGAKQGSESSQATTQASEVTTAIVNTESSPLNMRETASTDGKVITTIPKGETVQILERGTEWHYVQYGEYRGYCSASYLQIR